MLVVIIPGALSAVDETSRRKLKKKVTAARSLPLCSSPVSLKTKNNKKRDNSCTFPERERRVSFTKPDGDLP